MSHKMIAFEAKLFALESFFTVFECLQNTYFDSYYEQDTMLKGIAALDYLKDQLEVLINECITAYYELWEDVKGCNSK